MTIRMMTLFLLALFGGTTLLGASAPLHPKQDDGDDELPRPADIGTALPDGEWTVEFPDTAKNAVAFTSIAEERINGTVTFAGNRGETHGTMNVNVGEGTASDGSISFPVADMRTGNDRRDGHLRGERWLHAEENPDVSLRNLSAEKVEGTTTLWKISGEFVLRGVARDIELIVNVRYYESFPGLPREGHNGIVRVAGSFEVPIKEHGIDNPMVGSPAVAEVWTVEVAMFGLLKERAADEDDSADGE